MSDEQDQDRKPILDGFLLSDSPLDGSLRLDNLEAVVKRAQNPAPESPPKSPGFVEEHISTGHDDTLYSLGKMQPPKRPQQAVTPRKSVAAPNRRAVPSDAGLPRPSSPPARQAKPQSAAVLLHNRQKVKQPPVMASPRVAQVTVTPLAAKGPDTAAAADRQVQGQEARKFSPAVGTPSALQPQPSVIAPDIASEHTPLSAVAGLGQNPAESTAPDGLRKQDSPPAVEDRSSESAILLPSPSGARDYAFAFENPAETLILSPPADMPAAGSGVPVPEGEAPSQLSRQAALDILSLPESSDGAAAASEAALSIPSADSSVPASSDVPSASFLPPSAPLPSSQGSAHESSPPLPTSEKLSMSIAEIPPVPGPTQVAPSENISRPASVDPLADALHVDATATSSPPGDGKTPVPPKWGGPSEAGMRAEARSRAGGLAGPDLRLDLGPGDSAGHGASGVGAVGGPGGAWLWLPRGVEPRRSWPRRHPILSFLGICLVGALIFFFGRLSLQDSPISGSKLALIKVEGVLLDSAPVVEFIEKIARDDSIKGALLRVNSPGGAVGPSQEIYAALKRLQKKKPVVTSMGAVAASGGYYAAIAADKVYAGPSTLTASIGVKMSVPNMEGLMKTLGLSEKTLSTGDLKDAGSSWRPMSTEEEAYLRGLLNDMYEEFLAVVAKERSLSLERLRPLADGRAMTGRQALVAGLVDRVGDATDALGELKSLCKMDENIAIPLVEGPEEPSSLLRDLVLSLFRTAMREKLAAEQPLFMYR